MPRFKTNNAFVSDLRDMAPAVIQHLFVFFTKVGKDTRAATAAEFRHHRREQASVKSMSVHVSYRRRAQRLMHASKTGLPLPNHFSDSTM